MQANLIKIGINLALSALSLLQGRQLKQKYDNRNDCLEAYDEECDGLTAG